MKKNIYLKTTGILFLIVGTAHFLRILFNMPLRIGGWEAPMWLSWFAFIFIGFLAYQAFNLK